MLPGKIRHVRRLEWDDNEVRVFDALEGSGRHRIESTLLCAPDAPEFEAWLRIVGLMDDSGLVRPEQLPTVFVPLLPSTVR